MTRLVTAVSSRSFWWREALCAQVGAELFFGEGCEQAHIESAKKVCGTCPVLKECLASLLREEAGRARSELTGVRAGMTGRQRHMRFGHLCPGCGAERDVAKSRLCTACRSRAGQVLVDDRG